VVVPNVVPRGVEAGGSDRWTTAGRPPNDIDVISTLGTTVDAGARPITRSTLPRRVVVPNPQQLLLLLLHPDHLVVRKAAL